MDSITHALYKAIAAEDAFLRRLQVPLPVDQMDPHPGLQPLSNRKGVQAAYSGTVPTDLHIALTRGPELLAVQLEFIAMGYCPPAMLYERGADVIISPGRVQIVTATDDDRYTWTATLQKQRQHAGQAARAGWEELMG